MEMTPGSTPSAKPVLSPTRAIGDAWNTFKANPWISIGVGLVLCAILIVGQMIPFVNILFLVFVAPSIYAGGAGFFLRGARGENPSFESAFEGFQRWPSATGVALIIGIVSILIMLPMFLTIFGVAGILALIQSRPGQTPDFQPAMGGVMALAMSLTYPVLIWWSMRTSMALFAVMEPERPGVMEALKRSWSLTGGSFWRLFGFCLLTIPVAILGVLALCVGVIPAALVIYYGWAHAYLQLRARA